MPKRQECRDGQIVKIAELAEIANIAQTEIVRFLETLKTRVFFRKNRWNFR